MDDKNIQELLQVQGFRMIPNMCAERDYRNFRAPKLTFEVKNGVRNFENPQIRAFLRFCLESSCEWSERVKNFSGGAKGVKKAFNNFYKFRAFE